MRLALAAECEAARNSGPHAHNVLEAFDREFVDSNQGEAIAGRGFLELVGGDFALLEEPQDLLGCFLDFGFKILSSSAGWRGQSKLRGRHP